MVTVTVPMAAVVEAVSVRALVVLAGLVANPAVTPLGKPEADKVTLPLNPLAGETVMVLPPAVPCVMVTVPGEADKLKSGGGAAELTVKFTLVV